MTSIRCPAPRADTNSQVSDLRTFRTSATYRAVTDDQVILTVSAMTQVDHHDPVPVYRQLAAIIRRRIESGELQPRDPVPSELTLQQEHGVGRGTARKAIELLRSEGLVYTVPQRGTYVAEPEK